MTTTDLMSQGPAARPPRPRRRRPRLLIGPSIVATLVLGTLVATGAFGLGEDETEPGPVDPLAGSYVAIGDSFSSGEGAPNEERAEDGDNPCHRSDYAYAQRIADQFAFAGDERIVTCSGARSEDVLEPGPHGEPAQIDAVDDDTSLVTIGISGNDARWSSVIESCLLSKLDDCRGTEDEVRRQMSAAADEALEVYEAIRRRTGDDARIIAVAYPRFFPEEPTEELLEYEYCLPIVDKCILSIRITPGEQEYLNGLAHDFDRMLAERADAAGIEFVDTAYDAFAGHELGTRASFFNGLVLGWPDCGFPTSVADVLGCLKSIVQDESFHPNAAGQQRMAELVARQIDDP